MSKRIMRGSAGVAAALLTLLLAGCNDSETPTTTPATSSSSNSSTSSSPASSSAPSSTQPAKTDEAAQAVEDFYKQMDQLGANNLTPNEVTTWTLIEDAPGSDTRTKWTLMLEKQIFTAKVVQVGETVVSDVTAEKVEKPESNVEFDAAYKVTACVDRSGLTYTSIDSGKPKNYPDSAATKTWVTHLVVELKDHFRVARDTPGKSC